MDLYTMPAHGIHHFIFMNYSSLFLMETFLTVLPLKTQQGTRLCSRKAHILSRLFAVKGISSKKSYFGHKWLKNTGIKQKSEFICA